MLEKATENISNTAKIKISKTVSILLKFAVSSVFFQEILYSLL